MAFNWLDKTHHIGREICFTQSTDSDVTSDKTLIKIHGIMFDQICENSVIQWHQHIINPYNNLKYVSTQYIKHSEIDYNNSLFKRKNWSSQEMIEKNKFANLASNSV